MKDDLASIRATGLDLPPDDDCGYGSGRRLKRTNGSLQLPAEDTPQKKERGLLSDATPQSKRRRCENG